MRLRAAHVLGLVLLLTALCGCSFTYTEVGTGVPDTDVVRNALRTRSLLLVLDNCEHLLEACADIVHDLLTAALELTIMVTIRKGNTHTTRQSSLSVWFAITPLELIRCAFSLMH